MAAPGGFYNVAPDCVVHGLPPAPAPATPEILAPFKNCSGGFFTFGPGKGYAGAVGQPPASDQTPFGSVVQDPTIGLLIWTAIGFTVMVLAFIAWVRVEHRKLTAQAERLRARGPAGTAGTFGSG